MMDLLPKVLDTSHVIGILLCLVFAIYVYRSLSLFSGTPPGPWGLPIVGYLPFLTNSPHHEFYRLAKKYGNVFSVKIGARNVIILNTYDVIKEAYVKLGDFYTGKVTDNIEAHFGDYKSVFVTDGDVWREQRRFLLSALRDFGFGKANAEEFIKTEAQEAVRTLNELQGKPCDMKNLTMVMANNAIAYLIFGRRLPQEEEKQLFQLFDYTDEFAFFSWLDAFPILERLPHKLTGFDKVLNVKDNFYIFVDKIADEHEKTFDENNLRDVIDVYLMKFRQLQATGNDTKEINQVYTREHMRANIVLLFSAGTDTTSATLAWMFKLAAAYPKVQKRIQKEIQDVIGRERAPTLSDRPRMPYTEAAILEMQRYITLIPQTFYHKLTDDTQLNGYKIPKNALVMANIWSVHYDPKIWKEPSKFEPERFIGDDGKINKLREYVIPFSIGKRNCLGESLAKSELFLYFVTILQNFSMQPPPGEPFITEHQYFTHASNLKSYEVCAIPRN